MARKGYLKTNLTDAGDRDLPIVAVVGRPNVGKSTLFNRLTHSRRAIVDAAPGMTRDRLYGAIHRDEGSYRLVDTGGIEERVDLIAGMIRDQTHRAIAEAAIILFMIDGREGLTAADEEIAQALRLTGKPLILFVNKMDGGEEQPFDTGVYKLGFQETLVGSAEHNRGVETLLSALDEHLAGNWQSPKQAQDIAPIRLAIIGRPNAGKSSIVNKLLNEERVMVSEVPGTTRDPIDTYLDYKQRPFCLVDTAGIRKRGRISGSQESLSVMMARRQVEDADVIALMVDAADSGAAQDSAIAGIANDAFKPVIVVVNKWDLIEEKDTNTAKVFEENMSRRLKFLEGSPYVFISAKTGQRVTRVLDLAIDLADRASARVTTGVLNRFVTEMKTNYRVPSHNGKQMKIFYMTQVETNPPTFVVVTNLKEDLHFSQERFLVNRIREAFDLEGVPIRLKMKARSRTGDDE